jgi:hypothetical protein
VSESPTPRPPRNNARQRQQLRKEQQVRRQHVQRQQDRASKDQQLSPMPRFRMPNLPIPTRLLTGAAYLLLAVGLIVGIVYGLRFINPPAPVTYPNALWLGTEWTYDLPTEDEVVGLVARMQQNRIGTAYVWVSYLKTDQTWSGKRSERDPITDQIVTTINPQTGQPYSDTLAEMEPNIRAFVEQYNRLYPQGQLYGWISYPVGTGEEYTLADENIHTRIAELAALLVLDYGFDGVYLNVEPVLDGDENFLKLLRTVRLTLDSVAPLDVNGNPERIPVAVAIPPDWRPSGDPVPFSPRVTSTLEWSYDYKQSVALLVDEMLLMAYQSGLTRADDYSVWVAYQVQSYARALDDLGTGVGLWIGVPTYEAELPAHDPDVENIKTAIDGIRSGMIQAGEAASVVRGLTIYAEWTTDNAEWSMFQTNWISTPMP